MKTQVYSWRVAEDMKSELEQSARERKLSVSAILEQAVRDWLKKTHDSDMREQERLHAAVAKCLGSLAGGDPHRSENVRTLVRERLRRRYGR